jgi:hypothetical protein
VGHEEHEDHEGVATKSHEDHEGVATKSTKITKGGPRRARGSRRVGHDAPCGVRLQPDLEYPPQFLGWLLRLRKVGIRSLTTNRPDERLAARFAIFVSNQRMP